LYLPGKERYNSMLYRRSGRSGLLLPALSLGLWHNFGEVDSLSTSRAMLCRAFDLGITHFDLANNYGPPPGSAEATLGRVLKTDLKGYRDELVISTKAGYDMWPGPYGEWGSRKYLLASLDQSLRRMKLDYVDIFYSHRPDPATPLEETMGALAHAVKTGKALYVGISNYSAEQTSEAVAILRFLGTPCLIHQMKYSIFHREPELGLFDVLAREGVGGIAFSPLAQGLLSDRYLTEIPPDSRAGKTFYTFLKKSDITSDRLLRIRALNELARERGQTLAQMALAWVLRDMRITSLIIGASKVEQIDENIAAIENLKFSQDELLRIEFILEARAIAS
jgi:L-glyceraldehyde 3-phosphate reductase